MAFNPFHRFRKHKKAVFAGLTIMCMFVFVLQFGKGDAVSRLMEAFGSGKNRGDYVITLNGKKLYQGDLEKLGRRRKAANDYVLDVLNLSANDAFAKAGDQL